MRGNRRSGRRWRSFPAAGQSPRKKSWGRWVMWHRYSWNQYWGSRPFDYGTSMWRATIRWGIGGRLERTSATSCWAEGSVVWAVCCLRRPLGRWRGRVAGFDGAPKVGGEARNRPRRRAGGREGLRVKRRARRQAARALRERQTTQGLEPLRKATIGNGKSEWQTIQEEKQARQETAEEQLRVYRSVLPRLLKRLGKIPDPRNPMLIRHKLTVLLLSGVLMIAYQMTSRRETY